MSRSLTFVDDLDDNLVAFLNSQGGLSDGIRVVGSKAAQLSALCSRAGISVRADEERRGVVVLAAETGPEIDRLAVDFIAATDVSLVAKKTAFHCSNRPVFPISPAKAGTHLLFGLLEGFGFEPRHTCPDYPRGGGWYYLEFTNAHTSAKDFFVDTVRRSVHGNRLHAFPRYPSVMLYRHPLDMLVSEAGYYHKDGNTVFASYLWHLDKEDRLLRLVDDPWMLGSIRDRVGPFIPWLDMTNVFPVSFEELVGPTGGGTREMQEQAVWSLQIKLHVPGDPAEYADNVFNPDSPTFAGGQIGRHRSELSDAVWEKLNRLEDDYITAFGYQAGEIWSSRIEEFQVRVPRFSEVDHSGVAVMEQLSYLDHRILRTATQFVAIPNSDPQPTPENVLAYTDLDGLKFLIDEKVLRQRTART